MKKLILDACTKTVFSFNKKLYEQIDGVSYELTIRSRVDQIIMTDLASTIVKELIDKSLVKFYLRSFDDTLLLVKDKDINHIHKRLNSLDKNVKFTVDTVTDGNVHFLYIKIDKNNAVIYYEETHAGQTFISQCTST